VFIDLFAQQYPDALNIIQLDNGTFYTTDALVWPRNVILLAQPPYSPQLNAIERLWGYLKQQLEGQSFESLAHLRGKVESLLEGLSAQLITSLCGWDFIIDALLSASI
jgi:transposase